MKKSIFAILMALVLVFSLSPVDALAAGSSEMSPDIARIKESQELRIAIPAFDEVGFYEEGEDGELKGRWFSGLHSRHCSRLPQGLWLSRLCHA